MLVETLIIMGASVALEEIKKELAAGRLSPPAARDRMAEIGQLISKAAQEYRDT